jgi:hypothetical protein
MNGGGSVAGYALRIVSAGFLLHSTDAALREENFDRDPPNWEGINNRNQFFEAKNVVQDFGYSARSNRAGGESGEVGGRVNPAGEPAYYAYRLPTPLTLESPMSAEGKLYVAPGAGHFLVGFFNAATLKEWRTANSLVVRINSRGEGSHFHVEYCTSKWRANAAVIGEIVPGERINAKEMPNGTVWLWKLAYDPKGSGILTFTLGDMTTECEMLREHRTDGATFTHFGLMPIPKTWDSAGAIWIDDVNVNGVGFYFSSDPQWEGFNNRRTYTSSDTRPKFDFGWTLTRFAAGMKAGELGGLIFRGDCREASRMASYGDRIGRITFKKGFEARGRVCMLRGISDGTAAIGFYNSVESMRVNPSQQHSVPMGFLGINIEGPSSEGFFFYPVCRTEAGTSAVPSDYRKAPRIYPDGKSHTWSLKYDPEANGRVHVTLDEQSFAMSLAGGRRDVSFDRFGICTPWVDGNSVTVYFDDLVYTNSQD